MAANILDLKSHIKDVESCYKSVSGVYSEFDITVDNDDAVKLIELLDHFKLLIENIPLNQ